MGLGRRRHLLSPNPRSERPARHMFVDIETKTEKTDPNTQTLTLWFGWWCYWRRRPDKAQDTQGWGRFTHSSELWNAVVNHTAKGQPLYLIAHNLAFDLGVLRVFDELEERGFTLKSIYTRSMTSILRFSNGKRRIICLDNGNWFKCPLATLGEAIGFPKLAVDPLTDPLELVDPYCKRDVEIMLRAWHALYDFLDEHNLGSWAVTLPGQAMSAFRHRFMNHNIEIHTNEKAIALEREAYHGGRSSIFRQGEIAGGPFHKLDVNSMYPYVMQEKTYPTQLLFTTTIMTIETLRKAIDHHCAIARVEIETPLPIFPVLAKGHLVHPIGRFTTTLTTPELRLALEKAWVKRIQEVALFRRSPIFTDYVSYFYPLKLSYREGNNRPFYLLTKLYLNALYGKFGQREERWLDISETNQLLADSDLYVDGNTGETHLVYHLGGRTWVVEKGGEAHNSFPAIAAHVTAYARLYLWQLMERAGREHVCYCDTDSLIVDDVGLTNLQGKIHPTELGQLKLEGSADHLTINAPKDYLFGDQALRKGVPRKAEKIDDRTWTFWYFPSFRAQAHWSPKASFHLTRITKRMSWQIHDGKAEENGAVHPLRAEELFQEPRYPSEAQQEIDDLIAQIEALRVSRPLDQGTVFKLWDYRTGTWRRSRNTKGKLVPIEYSLADALATELGFPDLDHLQSAVTTSLGISSQIAHLTDRIRRLRQGAALEPMPETEPLPW